MRPAIPRRLVAPIAIVCGLLLSSLIVFQSSQATWKASTSNTGNQMTSGNVVLSDSMNGQAMFSTGNLVPGNTATKCINVKYSGSLNAVVRLSADYDATNPTSPLAQYLDFSIDEIGLTATCTAAAGYIRDPFLPLATTLKAKVDSMRAESADLGWAPLGGSNDVRRYRFTYTVKDNNLAQGQSAAVSFIWRAATLLDNVSSPGTFQTQLGCSANWKPDCAVPSLTDPDGDDQYTWQTTAILPGTYQTKISIGGTWGINYGVGGVRDGTNYSFTVPAGGGTTKFSFNGTTHVLTITVT